MSSNLEVFNFLEDNNLERDSYGNCEFSGLVEYKSPLRNSSEFTSIKLIRNGYNDGDIQITECGDLVAEKYHLDFSTKFQSYSYNSSDHILIVSGTSDKMGGEYIVNIICSENIA